MGVCDVFVRACVCQLIKIVVKPFTVVNNKVKHESIATAQSQERLGFLCCCFCFVNVMMRASSCPHARALSHISSSLTQMQ